MKISFKPYFGEPKTIKIELSALLLFCKSWRKLESSLKYSEYLDVRITFGFWIPL